jgi:hypothetical protein
MNTSAQLPPKEGNDRRLLRRSVLVIIALLLVLVAISALSKIGPFAAPNGVLLLETGQCSPKVVSLQTQKVVAIEAAPLSAKSPVSLNLSPGRYSVSCINRSIPAQTFNVVSGQTTIASMIAPDFGA